MTRRRGRELRLSLDGAQRVDARILGGEITVAASAAGARIEAEALRGPPLVVTLEHGTVKIRHRPGLLGRLLPGAPRPKASVVVFVPAATPIQVTVLTAEVLVTGIQSDVDAKSVSGSITLTGVTGTVNAKTVSGDIDADRVSGRIVAKSVSGGVVVSGAPDDLRVQSVSGGVTLDLGSATSVGVKSVSGDVAVRLPADADLAVTAKSVSGRFDSEFVLEGAAGRNGHMSGRIGAGHGAFRAQTVSGNVALLRRHAEAEAV